MLYHIRFMVLQTQVSLLFENLRVMIMLPDVPTPSLMSGLGLRAPLMCDFLRHGLDDWVTSRQMFSLRGHTLSVCMSVLECVPSVFRLPSVL